MDMDRFKSNRSDQKSPMKIKIRQSDRREFPYGYLKQTEKEFIIANVGNIFDVYEIGFNYYTLKNGIKIHIYDCAEV